MEIKFGEFEEITKPDVVKASLSKILSPLKNDKYNSIFVAYPHQCYSDDYQPTQNNPKQLEIYFYSLPSQITADSQRQGVFTFDAGNSLTLNSGQRDLVNYTSATPKGFAVIEDINGNRIAVTRENKIWVLYDLYHGVGDDTTSEGLAEQLIQYLIDNFINPPSQDELRHRMIDSVQKVIKTQVSTAKKEATSKVKQFEAELLQNQQRIVQLAEQLSYQNFIIESMDSVHRPNAEDVLTHIEKMPFVNTVKFLQGVVTIQTNPINIGPLQYSSWEIKLVPGEPKLKHEFAGKVLHPYEYSDHDRFCMGGFAADYATAMSRGELDKALSLCRLEITNYATTTRMHNIETFFETTMGKNFAKLREEIRKTKFADVDDVTISKINGNEVTYIGVKRKANGDSVSTADKVEIVYAK